MSMTEYDIHDESIKNGCIQLKSHIFRKGTDSKDFFELIDSANKIIEYIVKLERENCGLNTRKEPTKEDTILVMNHGIAVKLL